MPATHWGIPLNKVTPGSEEIPDYSAVFGSLVTRTRFTRYTFITSGGGLALIQELLQIRALYWLILYLR